MPCLPPHFAFFWTEIGNKDCLLYEVLKCVCITQIVFFNHFEHVLTFMLISTYTHTLVYVKPDDCSPPHIQISRSTHIFNKLCIQLSARSCSFVPNYSLLFNPGWLSALTSWYSPASALHSPFRSAARY